MRSDEFKALRLRRTQLQAELARINVLIDSEVPPKPKLSGYPANREQFYKDAENDFRNTDSNGNYITPPEDC